STGEQIQLFKPFCSLFLPFLGQCPARQANKFSFSNPFVRFSCHSSANVQLGQRTNSAFQTLLFAFPAFPRVMSGSAGEQIQLFNPFCSPAFPRPMSGSTGEQIQLFSPFCSLFFLPRPMSGSAGEQIQLFKPFCSPAFPLAITGSTSEQNNVFRRFCSPVRLHAAIIRPFACLHARSDFSSLVSFIYVSRPANCV
ncbi:MAG: hypothetical protein IK125_10070, partial [Lachnospiraceae bacterium]|nr:hypothetical protein [Lachnospiraceae bacterium]